MGGNLVNSSEFELGNSQTGMKMSARKMTSETILTFKKKKMEKFGMLLLKVVGTI